MIAIGPFRLIEIDGGWHRIAGEMMSYSETRTNYHAECGAERSFSWNHAEWGPSLWDYQPFTEPFRERPTPICRACNVAYAARLRLAADQVEAEA